MLPNSEGPPSQAVQSRKHLLVPPDIGGELFPPEVQIGFWLGQGTDRTSVPEATINEDGKPERRKGQVRTPGQALMNSISPDAFPPKRTSKQDFTH